MTVSLETPQAPYLINVGVADKKRADAMNLIFDPHSINFFPIDSISNGYKILFAGCGNGQLVVEVAKVLKERNIKADIVAFDISLQQLDCAQEYATQEEVEGISWVLHSANDLKEFEGQFNVVHARFLLNHLQNAELVTKLLCDTLVPNGFFIAEEFSGVDVDIFPQDPQYVKAVGEWIRGVKLQHTLQKSNIEFAKQLPNLLESYNMTVINVKSPNPAAHNVEQKNVFPECMTNAHRILPENEHDKIPEIIKELKIVRDSDCSITFKHFTQVLAKNRKSPAVLTFGFP